MSAAAQITKVLKAVPTPVYLAAGGALALYLIGRRLFEGGAAGVGEAIGRGAAAVVSGAAAGTAQAAGGVAGTTVASAIKLPGQIVDTALYELTGDRDISLRRLGEFVGGKLADFFLPYDPNSPNTPAVRRVAQATSPVRPEDKVSTYGTVN